MSQQFAVSPSAFKMKNISGAEQCNQFKTNWGIDTVRTENDDEGSREENKEVILGESKKHRLLYKKNPAHKTLTPAT